MFMRRTLCLAALVPLAAGCAGMSGRQSPSGTETGPAAAPPAEIAGIVAAPRPSAGARTADQFDTTTPEQKAAATAAPTGAEQRLGETIASLGDPTEPGLWVKTPLVSEQTAGRVEYPETGKSAVVELRPTGTSRGGSQVSLAAMRLIEAPLTDLPTLVVYRN